MLMMTIVVVVVTMMNNSYHTEDVCQQVGNSIFVSI